MEPEMKHRPRLFEPPQIPAEAREHAKAASDEMRKTFEALLPAGFVEHRRAARREMLLAWRSLIDARIEKLENAGKEKSEPKVTRINVE